jgi:hypothetical protein
VVLGWGSRWTVHLGFPPLCTQTSPQRAPSWVPIPRSSSLCVSKKSLRAHRRISLFRAKFFLRTTPSPLDSWWPCVHPQRRTQPPLKKNWSRQRRLPQLAVATPLRRPPPRPRPKSGARHHTVAHHQHLILGEPASRRQINFSPPPCTVPLPLLFGRRRPPTMILQFFRA